MQDVDEVCDGQHSYGHMHTLKCSIHRQEDRQTNKQTDGQLTYKRLQLAVPERSGSDTVSNQSKERFLHLRYILYTSIIPIIYTLYTYQIHTHHLKYIRMASSPEIYYIYLICQFWFFNHLQPPSTIVEFHQKGLDVYGWGGVSGNIILQPLQMVDKDGRATAEVHVHTKFHYLQVKGVRRYAYSKFPFSIVDCSAPYVRFD